ncbi:MAG: hypothetical protein JRJ39_00145 [Deltaproteobacteria bacterium]|nr:hypothetical protein [Deltaproteobacteria bacterium]
MKTIERSSISGKARSINYYLEIIGIERFGKIEVFSTAGDVRPPYPYQWRATSIVFGDDPFEGIGGTPLKALQALANSMAQNGL